MATDAESLRKYFEDMDKAEEADASLAGVSVDEWRDLGQPSKGPMAALGRAANAARIANTGPQPLDTSVETGPMAALTRATAYPSLPDEEVGQIQGGYSRRGQRLPPELQSEISRRFAKPEAVAPVPVVQAPVQKTEGTPSEDVAKMTAPSTPAPGAGGDAEDEQLRRLRLARLLAQTTGAFGEIASGRKLSTGVEDMLGERVKQLEALRAKRTERQEAEAKASRFGARLAALFPGLTPDQQAALTQATAEGGVEAGVNVAKQFKGAQTDKEVTRRVNEAALQSKIQMYPALAASLEPLRASAGDMDEKTWTGMLEKVVAGKAGYEAKAATTRFTIDKNGRFNQLTPGEVEQQKLKNDKIRQDIDLNAREFKLKEAAALAQPGKDDQEKAQSLLTIAEKEKGFGGYSNLAKDLAALEAAAPGFVTRGEAPAWLTTDALATAQKSPRFADPQVVKFLAKYADLANTKRHQLYGSAQTEGELRAFLQQLSDDPFFAGPEKIAVQMKAFADSAAEKATASLTRYSNTFGANIVDRVLGSEFRPLYDKGGVFADLGQKSPFVAPSPAAATPAAKVERVIMLDPSGQRKAVRADQVEKAKSQGWRMP